MRYSSTTQQTCKKATLYCVVFETHVVRYIAGFIFVFFVLHPAIPAFASEDVSVAETTEVSVPVPEPEVISMPAPETVSIPEEVIVPESSTEDSTLEVPKSTDIQEEGAVIDGTTELSPLDTVAATLPADQGSAEIDSEIVAETNAPTSSNNITENITDTASTSEESLPDEISETPLSGDEQESGEYVPNILTSDATTTATLAESAEPKTSAEGDLEETVASTSLATLSQFLASSTPPAQEPVAQVAGVSTSTDTTVSSEVEITPPSNTNDPQVDEKEVVIETPRTSNEAVYSTTEERDQEATTTSNSQISTTTPPIEIPLPEQMNTVTNNLNAYQFADKECVSVGDGSFYCSAIDKAPEYVEDGVFSAPDADGDAEIYVTINGKTTQITNNLTDDASPYYDGISNTIVWHSMKNDRFQIAQYDVDTGDITYLTNTSYNNMEPVAYGSLILWQAWIGDNWEIMMLNNGELSQLTNNSMHDITPQIRDGYIMWQTQFSEGWKIALYDTKTKKVSYIADSDGSEVTNPRFVLVYDSTDKIGDVQTLGYDFGSGASFVLGNLPAEIPEKIPKPDQTGETRALIQAKPTPRENEITEVVPTSSGTGSSTPPTDVTASSTVSVQEGDLVIQPIATSSTSAVLEHASTTTHTITPEVDTVDMQVQATSTDTTHIQDVVIPPFNASTTEEMG